MYFRLHFSRIQKEFPAVYIAGFTAGTNYYYIEAREGISKNELIQFVTNPIQFDAQIACSAHKRKAEMLH